MGTDHDAQEEDEKIKISSGIKFPEIAQHLFCGEFPTFCQKTTKTNKSLKEQGELAKLSPYDISGYRITFIRDVSYVICNRP